MNYREVFTDKLENAIRAKFCPYGTIPDHMHHAIRSYVLDHIEPGDFLQAVLHNDLMEAVGRADEKNIKCLPAWVALLYNGTPSDCWGSPEAVKAWLECRLCEGKGCKACKDSGRAMRCEDPCNTWHNRRVGDAV